MCTMKQQNLNLQKKKNMVGIERGAEMRFEGSC